MCDKHIHAGGGGLEGALGNLKDPVKEAVSQLPCLFSSATRSKVN